MTTTTLVIVIVVVAVILLALVAALLVSRRSRTRRREEHRERTREEFGEEYERTARERGSEEEAEKELRRRRGRMERRLSPLSDESRHLYEERMREVELIFVDNPERAVEMADRTVSDILVERRFITDSSQSDEETERNLAAMHPDVADDYREARRMRADVVARSGGSSGDEAGEQSTEDLRQTIQRYRAVYERIVAR